MKTATIHSEFHIYGDINVLNINVSTGHNVQVYPNVTFEVTGHIEIGDKCSIEWEWLYLPQKQGGALDNHPHIVAQCCIIDMDLGINANILIDEQKMLLNQ